MQGLIPTPAMKIDLKENENQLRAAEGENIRVKLHNQYEKIGKKFKDPSDRREHSLGSSSSTDRESKGNSCSAEDQKEKYKESYSLSSTNRRYRSSSLYLTEGKKKKHRSAKHKKDSHLKEEGHKRSNLHKEQCFSRISNSVREEKKIEPIYAEIINQCTQSSINSSNRDKLDSHDISEITNFLNYGELEHRNIQSISASTPSKSLRVDLRTSDVSALSTKNPSTPSESDKKRRENSRDAIIYSYSWLKFKAKLGYSIQQRAFIIPSVAFITFVASYSILMPKYYTSIQNLTKDPLLSIPIAIVSILFLVGIAAFISNLRDTRIKITEDKDDNKVFKQIKNINNKKCIRSIKLDLSNNTRYTLLDDRKHKTLALKKLELTLNRPLICAEIVAFATLTSTYLLTKYFEIGYKNLSDSLSTFNTSNIELIWFASAVSIILTLFACSFIHYYRKEYVEGLELKKSPREIESFNEEYVKEAESHYNKRDTLSSGKHSESKAASLTINQALVEYYDSRAVIIAN